MRIAPYKRVPPRRPIGLLIADRRVLMEDGRRITLASLQAYGDAKRIALYADAHLANVRWIRRGDGSAVAWNDRPVVWLPAEGGCRVYLLANYPGDGDEVMAGLVAWRDALHDAGARVGSVAAASMSLLRATLDRTLYLGQDRPKLSQVLGGRQQAFARPGVYGSFCNVDMSAAYARTLGELFYPGGWWREFGPGSLPTTDLPVMAQAVLTVPPDIIGPLPARPRHRGRTALDRYLTPIDYPVGRRVQGTWTGMELAMARAAGCRVRVLRSFVHIGPTRRPFERWWSVVQAGRKLPGYAGDLFKMTGNTLWGRFALDGTKTQDRYDDGTLACREYLSGPAFNPAYGADDVSELVASSVRARLYSELIVPTGEALLSVHTDGGLIRGPAPARCSPGWRVKLVGDLLVYLGPQMYAYRSAGEMVYVVSGVHPNAAPAAFAGRCRKVLGWPPTSYGDSIAGRERRALARIVKALDVKGGGLG